MRRALAATTATLALAVPAVADADLNQAIDRQTTKAQRHAGKGHPDRAYWHRHRRARLRLIAPYAGWLGSTGACESGGGYGLRGGLTAVSPGGTFRGRYQFDMGSWARAGGSGDPAAANWIEQAVRAVKWLRMTGAGSWPVCGH